MAFDLLDSILLYRVISIICQTFVYGIYFCLFPFSVHIMVTKGLRTRSRKWIFAVTVGMFALSSMYWITSVVVTFITVDVWQSQFDPFPRNPLVWLPMFSAVLLINYIVTDGVVVWRAWVLCSDQNRIVLMLPVITLGINTLIYLLLVAARAGLLIVAEAAQSHRHLAHIVDVTQMANLALSLLTNIFSTSIIAVKAWEYHKTLMANGVGVRTPTQAIGILGLVVESGMLYIVIGIVALASLVIHLPFGTLGDIVMPVVVQLAGMYPIIVLLLVENNRSLDTTYCPSGSIKDVRGGQSSRMEPMIFAARPVVVTGSEIGIATNPPNTDAHTPFGSALEPDDPEIGAGSDEASRNNPAVAL